MPARQNDPAILKDKVCALSDNFRWIPADHASRVHVGGCRIEHPVIDDSAVSIANSIANNISCGTTQNEESTINSLNGMHEARGTGTFGAFDPPRFRIAFVSRIKSLAPRRRIFSVAIGFRKETGHTIVVSTANQHRFLFRSNMLPQNSAAKAERAAPSMTTVPVDQWRGLKHFVVQFPSFVSFSFGICGWVLAPSFLGTWRFSV
jgi:hypothetical protein